MSLRALFAWLMILFIFCSSTLFNCSNEKIPPYKNAKLAIQKRVDDLLGRMTLDEKIGQLQCVISDVENAEAKIKELVGNVGVVLRPYSAKEAAEKYNQLQKVAVEQTRLGIPILMHDEALHGLLAKGATSFPQAIALAATWDVDLMRLVAGAIASETKSRGIRQVLSPVVNIARDVRWGRVEETYGEDPYLTAKMGAAFCRSFEDSGVVTTPKHYAANVGDGGRDSNPVHFSERLLREIYFPAFKACFQEGKARSVMAAYNSLDGLPCSANPWLLTKILREEWGFSGFVVSDYGSVGGIFDLHRTAASKSEAAKQAIEAGMDIELPSAYIFGEPLLEAVKQGMISERTIDQAVRRVLSVKFQLGLFENPYVDPDAAERIINTESRRQLVRRAAQEAIVLLKNENRVLPLKKDLKSIAVIGPLANVVKLGGYSGSGIKTVSPLEGIKAKVDVATQVTYKRGCHLEVLALPTIREQYLTPTGAKPGEHGLLGEYFNNKDLTGKPALVRVDPEIHFDWGGQSPDAAINAEQFSVRWTGKLTPPASGDYQIGVTTDDGVRLFLDGKLLIEYWRDRAPMTNTVNVTLEKNRQYDIKMEYYENAGGAYASLGWNYQPDYGRDIAEAVQAAKNADAAIVFVGIVEGEGMDRSKLDLPGMQEDLISSVANTGTPTVVVLINGSAVTMQNWKDKVQAIVEAWYLGEDGGNAIADVLFGDYNPGGKLPITFPQYVGQVPLYYNHKPTGRGYDYVDLSGKPLFPFGFGLSYTEFEYSNLQIDPPKMRSDGQVKISFDIKNVGTMAGDEVAQLYIHDPVASVARPVKELRGFQRVHLNPGENITITFQLTKDDISLWDANMKWVLEPGQFDVQIGSSSEDIRLQGSFEVTK
ncbi:MAG: glycoside hydrolase family 3 C-terminal domain-containing protein [candidate division KSB1 bacterium]|nr:glycoside hydrolase family 3 C-terminal domain-containing protein [candidate division KSB1 bacterium]